MALASSYSLIGPTAPSAGAASAAYTVTLTPVPGTVVGTAVITPASALGGTFTPATVGLTSAVPSGTFTFTPASSIGAAGTLTTTNSSLLPAPVAPVPTTLASGGTVAAGTYGVELAYVNANGETLPSVNGPITTTGATSTITVPSPPASGNATGWYAYVTQVGGSTYTRQQTAGSPTAIGTSLTLAAPPSSGGLAPFAVATAAQITDPGALSLTVQPPQGGMQALSGDCYTPTRGATLALTPGTTYRLLLTVTSLPTQMTAASLTIKATAGTGTALITKAGSLADVGTLTTAGTSYTGKAVFLLSTTDDAATVLAPGTSYEFGISVTCAGPETYEPAVNCILQSLTGGTAG